jgi:hypothetical protein
MGVAIGLVVLVPSLVALSGLAARGELEAPFEELDRHFRHGGGP